MKPKILAIIVSVVVLAAVVAAFLSIGSPTKQRALRFDEQRIMDLQNIQGQIITYWQRKNALPANLGQLTDSISGFTAPKDPESNQDYEYVTNGNLNFQLCSNFNLPRAADRSTAPKIYLSPVHEENWDHPAGRHCFDRTIDPQLYDPKNPIQF